MDNNNAHAFMMQSILRTKKSHSSVIIICNALQNKEFSVCVPTSLFCASGIWSNYIFLIEVH